MTVTVIVVVTLGFDIPDFAVLALTHLFRKVYMGQTLFIGAIARSLVGA